jgi:hypothetical protein
MNTRLKLVFVRAAATLAVATAVSAPCAAQYGVTYGPAYPAPLQSPEQWKQVLAMLAELNELDRLIAEVERQTIARCKDQSSQLSSPGQTTPEACMQLLQSSLKEQPR